MKRLLPIFLLLFLSEAALSRHIKGGEITYKYEGPGSNGSDNFTITLRLFLDCQAAGTLLDPEVSIAIYRNGDNSPVSGSPFRFPLTGDQFINLTSPNPCIINPSPVCYRLRTYTINMDLPKAAQGYTAIFQRCCRIDNINNISPNQSIGASYVTEIHGSNAVGNGVNSSPFFVVKDTVLICQNRPFRLDFGAVDPDADSLSYEFCDAYSCPSSPPVITNPPPENAISFVGYSGNGFSGQQPLGPGVRIDARTGLISGIAPSGGNFVVCVCVTEWRNGKRLTTHRKDFNVQVDDRCDFASAMLNPAYINCDGFDFTFQNEAPPSPLIHSFYWDFGLIGQSGDTSTQTSPRFVYPDTGAYKVKLIVNRGESCPDSAETIMKVYPGFFPGFTSAGACKEFPFQFTDTTKTNYGIVTGWNWEFGDETSTVDTSKQQNPLWKYSTPGVKPIRFIVGSSKGCIDTVLKDILVYDRPPIDLPFNDTLICSIDTLQLFATGTGIFSWVPNSNIINPNTANPLVYPKSTTKYIVTLNDRGCINSDSIQVRVVDLVTLDAKSDSTICLTDAAQLLATGDGLQFNWTPSATLDDPNTRSPVATPTNTTRYTVVAQIGKCSTTDTVLIKTVPYPFANAGKDTTICFEDTAQLRGQIVGARFTWTPASTLLNANLLTPLAYPLSPTRYILTVRDDLGCPKPFRDSIFVNVRPRIHAFAGRDTSIVIGQPLKLNASGAEFYQWMPSTGLSSSLLRNPVALLNENITYYLKVFTEEGCFAWDTLNIKVFKTAPDIFVPNAFTPDKESNNIFRPIPVGIETLDYFRVYNRWGQLVYSGNDPGRGWDGRVSGKLQNSGSYVWVVQGKDFTGKLVQKKGSMVLIR